MKKIAILLLLPFLLISCKENEQEKEKEKQILAEKNREIKRQVLEMCSKYNAVSDWESKIDTESFGTIYTFQLQDILLEQKEQPYLFFVEIEDIQRVGDKYLIIAQHYNIYEIYLYVNCDSDNTEKIIKDKQTPLGNYYALLVNVQAISKPILSLEAESDGDDIPYIEFNNLVDSYILKGDCIEVLPVGDYDQAAFWEDNTK